MIASLPYKINERGGVVFIRLKPNSRISLIEKIGATGHEHPAFFVRIGQPAKENKANTALIKFMAQRLDVAQSALSLVTGHKSRDKTLHITGDPTDIRKRLDKLIADIED